MYFVRFVFLNFFLFLLFLIFFTLFCFTILYWVCHTSTWICHECIRVPHPEPPCHLPPHTITLGHPSAPAPSILYPASNLDWQFISYMILYTLQCHSPKSSHPLPLPQSPKDCYIYLCLFCCLAYLKAETLLPTKVHLVKAMVFPMVMYGCESWTVKKTECKRIDAFELWC